MRGIKAGADISPTLGFMSDWGEASPRLLGDEQGRRRSGKVGEASERIENNGIL